MAGPDKAKGVSKTAQSGSSTTATSSANPAVMNAGIAATAPEAGKAGILEILGSQPIPTKGAPK